MVAKISIGSSLYGALSYNGEKMNKEQGRVLGANKIILPADGQIDIARMVENFNAFMPKTGKTKKPVLHISLNPHPDDRLTEQQYEILAREYLEKLGFGEQPYIIYKHMDIDRHHIHIVTVNVNEHGKRLNQDFLFRRSKKITTEMEEKYNLHKAQREKITPDMPIKKVDPSGDIKRQVANTVKMVGMRYKFQTMGEYNAVLSLYNIKCEQTDGRVNGREYHGLVYFATDDEGKVIANPFKASRLGKFASRTAVEGRFERAKEKIDVTPTRNRVADVLSRATDKENFTAKLKDSGIDVVFRYTDEGRIYGVTFIDHNTMTELVMSRYSFQTMGEYNAILSLYGLTSEETKGKVNGREYHGIVYSVLDDDGRKIGNPFKASRLGKFASLNAVHEKINRSEQKITRESIAKTRRKVSAALNDSHGKDDFITMLKERNIDLVLRYTDEGRMYGATFIDHDSQTVLNGSHLGRDFSANALNERFSNPQTVIPTPPVKYGQSQGLGEQHNIEPQSYQEPEQQASQTSDSPNQSNSPEDYDLTLPGLDLFQTNPAYDADEEDFKRRMKRKKKRGQRPKF